MTPAEIIDLAAKAGLDVSGREDFKRVAHFADLVVEHAGLFTHAQVQAHVRAAMEAKQAKGQQ